MSGIRAIEQTVARGFLGRLARDVRGNTLAIMAAALIPLAGLVGGGIDISRMYITKTRLQHACDAGALAGRKAMGGGVWGTDDNDVAKQFFDANFQSGSYGSGTVSKTFTESAGKVSGSASTVLPMTLMKIFQKSTETLSVTCDAEMRLPNTDVMFVLDNTGSMGDTLAGDTAPKLDGLKIAVKCFYEIVARLNTNATCVAGTPSGGTGDQVQVRFGFVPYDTNVNVGYLLPSSYFADSWPYQSRERTTVYGLFSSWDSSTRNAQAYGAWVDTSVAAVTINKNSSCSSSTTGIAVPADTYTINGNPSSWADQESATQWRAYVMTKHRNYTINSTGTSGNNRTCKLQYRERQLERRAFWNRSTQNVANVLPFPAWLYKQTNLNVSGLKNGSGWNSSMTLPIGDNHTDMTVTWDGCVEERHTVRQASYSPIPAGANDLDIDSAPSASNTETQWGPVLNQVIYPRKSSYSNSGSYTTDDVTTFNQSYTGESYSCLTSATKMKKWTDPSVFDAYVDSLHKGSNTYHDIGLVWGARLLSPTGIFRAENEFTLPNTLPNGTTVPGGGEIERHLIFMTDGESCTSTMNYQAYGLAWYDRRQTDPSQVPTSGCSSDSQPGTLTDQVNARTNALCTAIKNKNITLWVIWFGASAPAVETQMRTCATSGRFFSARNSPELQRTFADIANQISQLRLTR
ncbi:TadE/TadG family type IV pilus assembly protein [Sphingomonas alpina]|uniref:Pilus assembly protein n=2 Tax=Sphingomonas alpina TaxID=653931 RepID=A0A7H0LQK0_9SPHN|nr:TadE/TadG family type IV pilus assembly protein [Sphingomonas alpina]QNQ11953.1 pilus assembly protein [Sphingomonas alpina]